MSLKSEDIEALSTTNESGQGTTTAKFGWLWAVAIGALVLVGFAIRLAGREWGLPYLIWDDEVWAIQHTWYIAGGDLTWAGNGFYDYPYFGLNFFALYFRLDNTLNNLPGAPTFRLTLRLLEDARISSALWGGANTLVIYKLGKQLYGRWVGLIAALWATFAAVSVYYGMLAKPDQMAATLSLLGLFYTHKLMLKEQRKFYIWAGIWIGLAVTTKYTVAPVAVIFVLAHILGRWTDSSGWRTRLVRIIGNLNLWLGIGAAIIAFFVGTPLYLVRPVWFFENFFGRFVSGNYMSVLMRDLVTPIDGFWYTPRVILSSITGNFFQVGYTDFSGFFAPNIENFGLLLVLLAFGYACIRRMRTDILLVSLVLLFYAISYQALRVPFWHYLMTASSVLLILTARMLLDFAGWLVQKLTSRTGQQVAQLTSYGLVAVVALLIAGRMFAANLYNLDNINNNSWNTQLGWINTNLPAGSKIAYEVSNATPSGLAYNTYYVYDLNKHPYDWYVQNGFNYVFTKPRPATNTSQPYQDLSKNAKLVREFPGKFLQGATQIWELPLPPVTQPANGWATLQPSRSRPPSLVFNGDFEDSTNFSRDWYATGGNARLMPENGQTVLQITSGMVITQAVPIASIDKTLSFSHKGSGELIFTLYVFNPSGEALVETFIALPASGDWRQTSINLKQEVEKIRVKPEWVGWVALEFFYRDAQPTGAAQLDNLSLK